LSYEVVKVTIVPNMSMFYHRERSNALSSI